MSQDQVKRLSTLVAAHMSMCLDAACGDLYASDDVKPEEIRKTWEKVAAETLRLDVIPPAFEQLRRKRNRRKPVPYELIPGSLARMLCADWWYRKLWKMRCEWREEQLRAVCLVSKKASPYVSYEAVMHKREQRRKSLEFFRSHELVNEDGDTLDMEDVVNASSSNPAHRRNEMMACVKGLELIAEMRGDCAVFYTITCPSRFHSTLNNGRPNPTWTNATVRQSSDYLVGMFAAFRKAMHKAGLRWYGVRVPDFETLLAERKAEFVALHPKDEQEAVIRTLELESEPVTKLLQENAYRELLLRQRINEAAQAVMVAYAIGGDLDQLAANYNVKRLTVTPADNDAVPPVAAVMESDEALRLRVPAAFEGLSVAGPTAAYEFHARSADGRVADASATSPAPAEVVLTVLSREGDGTAEKDLLDVVEKALNSENVRPVADRLTVRSAEIIPYRVEATIFLYPGWLCGDV
ncbi:hypothetical protein HCI37_14415 [Escherichia coli]|nr:hypothetical protein [Escherichia coli]